MIVNIIVIFLVLFIALAFASRKGININKDSNRKNFIKTVSIIYILESGLRNIAVGTDTYQYFQRFKEVRALSFEQVLNNFLNYILHGVGRDEGYSLLTKILQIVISDYQLFLFFIAILFFTSFGKFVYNNTNSLGEIVFAYLIYSAVFFSFFSITGHRQTIATALVLLSFNHIKNKEFIKFMMYIIVAATIHKSCLIFVPAFFLIYIRKPKFVFIFALLLFPIIMYFRLALGNLFTLLGGYEVYKLDTNTATYTFTIMILLVSIFSLFRMKKVLSINPDAFIYFNIFALAILFVPLTWINPNSMRVVQYFSLFMVIIIPRSISSFRLLSHKLKQLLYAIAFFTLIFLFIKANSNLEYKFFWQDMELNQGYLHR